MELRQSAFCATVWSRVYNLTTSNQNLRETIILYGSPNVTGQTSYPITDNSIPPGGSAWSKQYRDRPSFRAMGEVFFGGVWRSAQTDPSLMWAQYDGNYANVPTSQPYTCNETAGNYCHRWPTNSDGTPVFLLYKDDPSLSTLAGTPVGDIDFILSKYDALTGPAPNLGKTTGSNYDILISTYTDAPNIYAVSLSYSLANHPQYYYYGHTFYNTVATFAEGYKKVECDEFLHVLGFMHITVNGFTGSQSTCMGMGYATGPYIDDQFLLTQTYSTPLAP